MRSSKSRSRSKSNRNRPQGANVVNRVFDSNGPEGKVRGTPQQIIDKYNQLARDSQLGNDRVATENFQQHAEHYLRMLNEAQREIDSRREEQERHNRERQAERDRERTERLDRQERDSAEAPMMGGEGPQPEIVDHRADTRVDPRDVVIEPAQDSEAEAEDNGLVETPEGKTAEVEAAPVKKAPARKPRARKPAPAADGEAAQAAAPEGEAKPKRSRKPKPKPEEPQEAAE